MYPLSLPSGVMPKISIALHLPVAFDDITRQLINCNDNYRFSVCPHSVLQEFAVDNKVIVKSHSIIVRKMHAWCTSLDRVLKRSAFITDELDIPWVLVLVQFSAESLLSDVYVLFELPSTTTDSL